LTAGDVIAINMELQTDRSMAKFFVFNYCLFNSDRGSSRGIAMNPPNASVDLMSGINMTGALARR
jgi:hypothetical protein